MSDLECKTCDTNTAEPEAPKVIVVVEAGGKERRYDADSWALSAPPEAMDVRRSSRTEDPIVGHYAPGAFLSVREDGSSTGDPFYRQGKKLAIAMDALREIGGAYETGTVAHDFAHKALDDIADVDL